MKVCVLVALAIAAPVFGYAQGVGESIYSLNNVLDRLFEEMMPLCRRMMDVGRVIAGFAALFYIGYRVWRHIARAEAIDFFPLLRPFALGLAILAFPSVVALMNGVLRPIVVATAEMSKDSKKAIQYNIDQQEKASMESTPLGGLGSGGSGMEKYEQPDGGDDSPGLFSAFSLTGFKNAVKIMIRDLFGILHAAAGLCVNTVSTFFRIVLVILGPLVFGLSVFDGFQQSLVTWFSRYINVYLWLPIANIFGAITAKILENMSRLDHGFAGSTAYIIFLVIATVGYTAVPTVANYIVQAGDGRDSFLSKVNETMKTAGKAAAAGAGALI